MTAEPLPPDAVRALIAEAEKSLALVGDGDCTPQDTLLRRSIDALASRTVETAEELDALWSDVTVLRASNGSVFGPCHGFEYEGWWQLTSESPGNAWKSAPLLEDFGPVAVLNAPVPTARECGNDSHHGYGTGYCGDCTKEAGHA